MSNFQCPHCGMVNIDCGKLGYKTPKEIELEKDCDDLRQALDNLQEDYWQALDDLQENYWNDSGVLVVKLEKIREICSDDINQEFDITGKLKVILQIIEEG